MAITKPKTLEDYIQMYKDSTAASKSAKESAIIAQTQFLKEQARSENKAQNEQINQKYADLERALLVQKIINERNVKENNENLGLTRSGKNLSENAAVQIAYSNALSRAETAKQSDKNAAKLQVLKASADAELSKNERLAALGGEYERYINSSAEKSYEKDLAARIKESEIATKNQKEKTDTDKELEELLVSGIQKAKNNGSGYLFTFINSLNLTKEQLPILRKAFTRTGVPADFFENYLENGYQGVFLIPIED